jgi:hypothetical protein
MKILAIISLLFGSMAVAQTTPSVEKPNNNYVSSMQTACDRGGTSMQLFHGHVVINLPFPSPDYARPTTRDPNHPDQYLWDIIRLNIFMISFDLADLDETKIGEEALFTPPYFESFKEGDVGDTIMVHIETDGKPLISRSTYDPKVVNSLPPDKLHGFTAETLGGTTIQASSAVIPFSDRAAARSFETALRNAIITSKAVKP